MRPRRKRPPATVPPGEWSGPRPFVGRAEVLAALDSALADVLRGHGQFVLLHGPDGSGRAALGRRFVALAGKSRRGLRSAIADAADPSQPAFRQLAFHFTARRRAGAALRRSAAGWIGLLPVIGNIVAAVVETVQTIRKTQDSVSAPTGSNSTIDQVRLLLTFGGNAPRIILLENLEASDPDELAGAFALIQRLPQTRTLFIGTALSTAGKLPSAVRDLVLEAERLAVGRLIEIPRLSLDLALGAVEEATGTSLSPAWRSWFEDSAPGTPTELWQFLGELERDRLLTPDGRKQWRWADTPPAPRLSSVAAWATAVAPEERRLLTAAALCGPVFRVSQLTRVLGWSELKTEDLLAPLLRRRLVTLRETVAEGGDLIDIYAFASPAEAAAWAADAPSELREEARRRLDSVE